MLLTPSDHEVIKVWLQHTSPITIHRSSNAVVTNGHELKLKETAKTIGTTENEVKSIIADDDNLWWELLSIKRLANELRIPIRMLDHVDPEPIRSKG